MGVAIQAEGLGKAYKLGQLHNIFGLAKAAVGGSEARAQLRAKRAGFWALKDVSFQVNTGESLAIIGANGSGKSTLLKILSEIVVPTEGTALIRGKVGALLEVGTGMHPELTGRENVMLNGSILGMKRREIALQMDSIVEFAGVERFLDTPLKRYSTGMQVRLGFAVAAHLRTETLIVDEVLAVGDATFQRRCLARLDDAVEHEGRTVLLVTHNLAQARQLCPRAIMLQAGEMKFDGSTEEAIGRYMQSSASSNSEAQFSPNDRLPASITRLASADQKGVGSSGFSHEDVITLEIEWVNRQTEADLHVVVTLVEADGMEILVSADDDLDPGCSSLKPGKYKTEFQIPSNLLNEGTYHFRASLVERHGGIIDHQTSGQLEVHDLHDYTGRTLGKRGGAVLVPIRSTQAFVEAVGLTAP